MAHNTHHEPTIISRFKAYAPDGTFKGIVKLTRETKARYETRGYTFKRASEHAS